MTVQEWEKDFYGNNVIITTRDNECVIYRIRDDSGDSVLTRFEVYPGIALIYNDVQLSVNLWRRWNVCICQSKL